MIPIAKPLLGDAEAEAARAVVLSGWVTQGPEVAAFEQAFANAVAAPHACAVSSGTAALQLALAAVGVQRGDTVITVSHSFIAAANAVRACGAEPAFVDVERDTFNIDPRGLAAALSASTRAVLCVHQMGMPCDMAAILSFARSHGLPVIEDAACATGSEILVDGAWRRIGAPLGDIACFSFHPRKVITTGEGGMLTTGNAAWDARFRLLRHQGMDIADTARHQSPTVVFESYPVEGGNFRMTDIQAAIGRKQIERLTGIVARRRQLAASYGDLFAGSSVETPVEPAWARSNWQSYCVRLPPHVDQRRVMQQLLDQGISTRRGIMCAHREPPYADAVHAPLVQSEEAQDRCILLPLFPQMSDDDQARVAAALVTACAP